MNKMMIGCLQRIQKSNYPNKETLCKVVEVASLLQFWGVEQVGRILRQMGFSAMVKNSPSLVQEIFDAMVKLPETNRVASIGSKVSPEKKSVYTFFPDHLSGLPDLPHAIHEWVNTVITDNNRALILACLDWTFTSYHEHYIREIKQPDALSSSLRLQASATTLSMIKHVQMRPPNEHDLYHLFFCWSELRGELAMAEASSIWEEWINAHLETFNPEYDWTGLVEHWENETSAILHGTDKGTVVVGQNHNVAFVGMDKSPVIGVYMDSENNLHLHTIKGVNLIPSTRIEKGSTHKTVKSITSMRRVYRVEDHVLQVYPLMNKDDNGKPFYRWLEILENGQMVVWSNSEPAEREVVHEIGFDERVIAVDTAIDHNMFAVLTEEKNGLRTIVCGVSNYGTSSSKYNVYTCTENDRESVITDNDSGWTEGIEQLFNESVAIQLMFTNGYSPSIHLSLPAQNKNGGVVFEPQIESGGNEYDGDGTLFSVEQFLVSGDKFSEVTGETLYVWGKEQYLIRLFRPTLGNDNDLHSTEKALAKVMDGNVLAIEVNKLGYGNVMNRSIVIPSWAGQVLGVRNLTRETTVILMENAVLLFGIHINNEYGYDEYPDVFGYKFYELPEHDNLYIEYAGDNMVCFVIDGNAYLHPMPHIAPKAVDFSTLFRHQLAV